MTSPASFAATPWTSPVSIFTGSPAALADLAVEELPTVGSSARDAPLISRLTVTAAPSRPACPTDRDADRTFRKAALAIVPSPSNRTGVVDELRCRQARTFSHSVQRQSRLAARDPSVGFRRATQHMFELWVRRNIANRAGGKSLPGEVVFSQQNSCG